MKWGIVFKLPAAFESELWAQEFPPPSYLQRLNRSNGSQTLLVSYHFTFSPQGANEWQRVAEMKIQMQNRITWIEFQEYRLSEITGNMYTISELGKYFRTKIMFPKPQYPRDKKEAYKMLCRYVKRLHYYQLFQFEQLVSISFRFNRYGAASEGPRQTVRRASGAYQMALKHRENWPQKLSSVKRYQILRAAALRTAEMKRSDLRRGEANSLRREGKKLDEIAYLLGISRSTVMRWLKEAKVSLAFA